MGAPVHSEIIIMKAFIFATVLAVAAAIPIEDTDDVKAAKATFKAAFDAATAGEHIALRPAATATAYLDDAEDVAAAKAEFQAVFDKYAAGEVALPVAPVHEYTLPVAPVHEYTLPVAPVHEVKAVEAPAVAPVAIAAPVAPLLAGAYPYAHGAFYGKSAPCVNAANVPVPCHLG